MTLQLTRLPLFWYQKHAYIVKIKGRNVKFKKCKPTYETPGIYIYFSTDVVDGFY